MSQLSRHSSPVLVRDGEPILPLQRVHLGTGGQDGGRREEFVQTLVHNHPEILPMADIDPALSPLVSICRELPTSGGYLDNLWLTPNGGIVLGECKLVKNPQARREVLAQALEYARALSEWQYDELERASLKGQDVRARSLWGAVRHVSNLQEQQFVDAVQRRLRSSRFMILIVGDGIQQGVEALTSYLQLHAGLHIGLALVDLSIWELVEGGLLVVPRIPMRTILVERGIVVPDTSAEASDRMPVKVVAPIPGHQAPASTTSDPDFEKMLVQRRPDLLEPLRSFLHLVRPLGVTPQFAKSLSLQLQTPEGSAASVGTIEPSGKVWFTKAYSDSRRAGREAEGAAYLNNLAHLIHGSVKEHESGSRELAGPDGRAADLMALLAAPQAWRDALADLATGLNRPRRSLEQRA